MLESEPAEKINAWGITMSITIQLPPAAEAMLRERAKNQGETPENVLAKLAQEWLASKGNGAASKSGEAMSAEEWIANWRAWAASHPPVDHFVDDSRESIYEGRGE